MGLSGVGKTCLAQALFDKGIGKNNLDPAVAIYTNLSDSPDPGPTSLTSNLIANQTRSILIIDNCSSELHQRLGEKCRSHDSKVSIITIEYNVRDDSPEGTEFFELKPSSQDLIKRLISQRYPAISSVDRETIAGFSDGNARIAIALAGEVRPNEIITGLSDNELFRRLFQQSHGSDSTLLEIAQACSLVYSFNTKESVDCVTTELTTLGVIVGKNHREMYQGVAKIMKRDLVQRRGDWRAVLPHAIANRLAAEALKEIPLEIINREIVQGGSRRLLHS